MQDPTCHNCHEIIRMSSFKQLDEIKCLNCGATYTLCNKEVEDLEKIELEYDFSGYQCIYSTYTFKCEAKCPAPYMFCEEHTSDEHIEAVKRDIKHAEERLNVNKEKLDRMYESKKNRLIGKLGGLSDNNIIQKDKDWEDPTVDDMGDP